MLPRTTSLYLSLFAASLLLGAALAGAAHADELPHAGLAGTWLLDADASEDMDPLLKALGRSKLKRTMAKRLKKIVHEVTASADGLTVRIQAGPMDETSTLDFDQPRETFIVGGSATVVTTLEGATVVSVGEVESDGQKATYRAERSLRDADTTLLVHTLTLPDQEPVRVERVFRRQP